MSSILTMKDHRSLFRQLLAGMYDAVLITDPSGHLLELNARAKEYFQFNTDEVMDSPIGLFIPGVTPQMIERIRAGLEQARHMMIDGKCRRKDGTTFVAEITVSLIDLLNPGDLVFTIRNTERRRGQISSLRTVRNAYDIAQASLFACTGEGKFRSANKAFLQMFGFEKEEELFALSFNDLLDDEPLANLFERALKGETVDIRLTAQEDGDETGDIEVKLAPDIQGKVIIGVVGSVNRV